MKEDRQREEGGDGGRGGGGLGGRKEIQKIITRAFYGINSNQ